MKVELREHGSHVAAGYGVPEYIDPAPLPKESVDDDDGTPVYTRRYDKGERVADTPRAMGQLRQVHADAIEYRCMRTGSDGFGLVLAVLVGVPCVAAAVYAGMPAFEVVSGTEALLILGMAAFMAWLGLWFVSDALDGVLFALEDLPVIFDRKHRKVYRLLPDEGTGFWNVLRRRPLVTCEYEWDLVDVASRVSASSGPGAGSDSGNGRGNDCSLVFRVRKGRSDLRVLDRFQIGVLGLKADNLDPVWEHIRRFMEEDGPPLPDPGETLVQPAAPESWWACLRLTGKHAPFFLTEARSLPMRALVLLPLFLLGLPFRLLVGMERYLKGKTRLRVRWPAVVLERTGPPLPAAPAPPRTPQPYP